MPQNPKTPDVLSEFRLLNIKMQEHEIDEQTSLLENKEIAPISIDTPVTPRRFLMLGLFALCAIVNISGFLAFAPVATILASVTPAMCNIHNSPTK